jgi:adenosylhomocysteine nucleosidase
MKRIAIIAAMPGELKPFLDANAKEGWVYERRGNVRLWRLIWPDDQGEWVVACGGMGQEAATRAFAEVEKDGRIDRVISTGWAGALRHDMKTGNAYRAAGVIDLKTGERFAEPGWTSDEPWLVTSPRVVARKEKEILSVNYYAGLVDMEAAAIARLAAMRGIPFACVKGVSDGLSDDLLDFNRFISPQGQLRLARLLFFVLLRPWHWPRLVRMGENSKKASQAIRDILLENLYKPGVIAN